VEIIKRAPKALILHTLTEAEAEESLAWIESNFQKINSKLIPSFGDVLIIDEDSKLSELDYRFGSFTSELCEASKLWQLIKKFRPDMIVDGINTATVIGYGNDPYTISRKIKEIIDSNALPDKKGILELLKESLMGEAIPPLVRFTQVLYRAMMEFGVKRYVKISTSGLGGMGFNIQYTHGDVGEPGCSPRLLGKVAASGILNQLIWTLSHTPGLDIKMIIPTALVGWEDITTNITMNRNGLAVNIPVVDCEHPLELSQEDVFSGKFAMETGETLKMTAVDSGENGFYGIGDMTTITALGQMGCITKEEVGIAVADALDGSSRYDVCSAMDSACMGPSFNSAFERNIVLNKMKEMDKTLETTSVATGNLGPKVTKHLWELEIIRQISGNIKNVLNTEAKSLSKKAEKLLLEVDPTLRRQILSLRMPILLEGMRILLGKSWHIPEDKTPQNISENSEIWAMKGWVDVRSQRMLYWQREFSQVVDFIQHCRKTPQVRLQSNWQNVPLDKDFEVGEVLGLIYSLNGGERKL
jgi:nitrogen fixation protein